MNLWIVTDQALGSRAYHQVNDQWEEFGRLESEPEVKVDSPVQVNWELGIFDNRPSGERPYYPRPIYSQPQTDINISLEFVHRESQEHESFFYLPVVHVSPPWLTTDWRLFSNPFQVILEGELMDLTAQAIVMSHGEVRYEKGPTDVIMRMGIRLALDSAIATMKEIGDPA